MRKKLPFFGTAFLGLFVMAACEGPAGPAGPAGPTGPEGPQGPPGEDPTVTCTDCHTSDTEIFARQVQYENSTHFNGGNFERASSTYAIATFCAVCHAHEGFQEFLDTGNRTTAAGFENPSPVNCRTCHNIHETYTAADYGLTTTATVDTDAGEGVVDFGDGNLCANCHQGRAPNPKPVEGGGPIDITSFRYGYHHGPQAQVLGGVGGVALTGTATVPSGPNTHGGNDVGCPACHMTEPWGAQAGGHTWALTYEYHGATEELIGACTQCHSSATSFDLVGIQTTTTTQLDSLWTLLVAAGIGADGDRPHAVEGTWDSDLVAAFLNFQMVEEDRSLGVHNPPFVGPLLTNSIEVAETFVP